MAILDATVLIDQLRGNRDAQAALGRLLTSRQPLRVPSICWVELLRGVPLAKHPRAVRDLEAWVEFEPFGREAADIAVRLQHELVALGRPLAWNDLQVAATALLHREPVVTRDNAFAEVPGLTVDSY